jgi:hypothetical protein
MATFGANQLNAVLIGVFRAALGAWRKLRHYHFLLIE